MVSKENIRNLVSKMNNDSSHNLSLLKLAFFGNLNYKDEDNQSILHILVDDHYDEYKCFMAVKTLLEYGLSPNLEDDFNYNFIQTALYAGYSESFILRVIGEAIKYNLNVNHVDSDKDSIMHTAIYSDDYHGEINKIYELLCKHGFKSDIRCGENRNLLEAMVFQNTYSKEQINKFKEIFEGNVSSKEESAVVSTPVVSSLVLSEKDITELEKFGKVLNKKKFISSPTVGREKEVKNLMITLAQEKKRPLLVGESGVGKTSIVDELAYRIQTGNVPSFLQGKVILEVSPSEIVSGCQYVGMFEQKMNDLLKLCERLNVIIFIDEIHTIYGIGTTKDKNNDMAAIIKHYIDRSDLKVIGTTTDKEYNEFFSKDALKRRFEKVSVKEPDEKTLIEILDKVFNDYFIKTGLMFEDESIKRQVINIIISSTSRNHRVYDDIVNNPDLAISIIDKAFAFAKIYDNEFISVDNIIESFEFCDRIYDGVRSQTIDKLRNLKPKKVDAKILKIDFTKK